MLPRRAPRQPPGRFGGKDLALLLLGLKFPVAGLIAWGVINWLERQGTGEIDFSEPIENTVNNAGMVVKFRETRPAHERFTCQDNTKLFDVAAIDQPEEQLFPFADAIRWLEPEPQDESFVCGTPTPGIFLARLEWRHKSTGVWDVVGGNTPGTRNGIPGQYSQPPAIRSIALERVEPRYEPTTNLIPDPEPAGRPPLLPPGSPVAPPVAPAPPTPVGRPRPRRAPPLVSPPVPSDLGPVREAGTGPGVAQAGPGAVLAPSPPPSPAQPQPTPRVLPASPPTTTPIGPTGPQASPEAAQRVKPTPPGQRKYGNVVIPGPDRDVPPRIEAVAAEVGRIERKLGKMLTPQGLGGDGTDLLQLLLQVIDLLSGLHPAAGYQITSECHRDATGEPLPPLTAEWSGGAGSFNEINKKLDALALLVQHHRNLPGHVCRRQPPEGQVVSVLFNVDPS